MASEGSSLVRYMVAASLLHAVVLWSLSRAFDSNATSTRLAERHLPMEVWDLAAPEGGHEAPSSAATSGARAAKSASKRTLAASASAARAQDEAAPGNPAAEPPSKASGPNATADATAERRALTREQLGLDGALRSLMLENMTSERQTKPDAKQQAEERLARSIQGAMLRRDSKLGLGSGGPILSALEQFTRASTIPVDSTALFSIVIDQSGSVRAIDVIDVDLDRAGWKKMGRQVAQALRKKKLRVPKGTRGVRLKIAVVSRSEIPGGASPGQDIDLFGVPLHRTGRPNSKKLNLAYPVPQLKPLEEREDDTNKWNSDRRPKVPPGYHVEWKLFGIPSDPAEILTDMFRGTKRMVRAHVVDEQPL